VFLNNTDWEILTPDGWSDFSGVAVYDTDETIKFETINGNSIEVTPNHPLMTDRGWKKASSIRNGAALVTESGISKVSSKTIINCSKKMYDPAFVVKDNKYYANGIVSHNTSISLLFVDEVAFIMGTQWAEFWDSVYPTISSGQETKVILVSTPKGLNHFYKLWVDAESKRSLFVANSINWWDVPGRDEKWKADTISNIGQETFDQEFGAEFIGSSGTLLNSQTLRKLVHANPELIHNNLKIYQSPIEGHQYMMTVDCSEGVGGDSSAFSVIDITAKPYNQVATYKNNRMNPMVFPDFIYQTATKYNTAFVLIEIQSTGKQVADTLVYEFGYENVAWVGQSTKHGQQLMSGASMQQQNGLRTDKRTKRIGCSNAKQIIESDLLIINDEATISEFSTFISKGSSYEADDNAHDDMVMTIVLFAWATTQEYFKSLNNSDARAAVLAAYKDRLAHDMLPQILSIAMARDEPETEVRGGIVWHNVN
jgi:hypothetical protein